MQAGIAHQDANAPGVANDDRCKSREYTLSRIRTGVLESGTVEVLRATSVDARMTREGIEQSAFSQCIRNNELVYFASSEPVIRFFCEQYAGLPYES